MPVLQKSQKFGVRVWGSCRNYRSSRYGYGSVKELTEVPGIVIRAYRTHRSSGQGIKMLYSYPGYLWHGRTELTEVPGTAMNVVQNLQKFRVRVRGVHMTGCAYFYMVHVELLRVCTQFYYV